MTPHKVMAHQAIIRYQQALQSVYQTDRSAALTDRYFISGNQVIFEAIVVTFCGNQAYLGMLHFM